MKNLHEITTDRSQQKKPCWHGMWQAPCDDLCPLTKPNDSLLNSKNSLQGKHGGTRL